MRIGSWSLDNINDLLSEHSLYPFVHDNKLDVLFFQNLNSSEAEFRNLTLSGALGLEYDYYEELSFRDDKKGGCAVFISKRIDKKDIKVHENNDPEIERVLNGKLISEEFEGRVQAVTIKGITFVNVAQINAGVNLEYAPLKANITNFVSSVIEDLSESSFPKIVVLGDFKTVLKNVDIHNGVLNTESSGFSDTERNALERLILKNNLVDVYRMFEPYGQDWTYYPKLGYGIRYGKGWRTDYVLVGKALVGSVSNFKVLPNMKGSSHVPLIFDIEEV